MIHHTVRSTIDSRNGFGLGVGFFCLGQSGSQILTATLLDELVRVLDRLPPAPPNHRRGVAAVVDNNVEAGPIGAEGVS